MSFLKLCPPSSQRAAVSKHIYEASFNQRHLASADTKSYLFILCPNTLGIPAGETKMVKGSSDDNMAEHFRDLGKHAIAWLTIQTKGSDGVLPFNLALQTAVEANKVELDLHYPNTKAVINLTQS